MPASKDELKELARGVVAAQGNTFIKDLLRTNDLQVGGSKGELLERLEKAIDADVLVEADFEQWLAEVEGWGHFHVYPFTVPGGVRARRRWQPARIARRIAGSTLEPVWDAGSSLAFPEEPTLTHASLADRTLRLLWHQGVEWRRRDKDRDRREVIDDEVYEFDAYLVRHERKVVRFVMGLDAGVAAALVPYRLQEDEHEIALALVWDELAPLLTKAELEAFPVRRIITKADRQQLGTDGGRLTTKAARLESGDAWVEFGSSDADGSYADVDAVREVRRVAAGPRFRSGRATFLYGAEGRNRPIHVALDGDDQRIWLPAQVREQDLWALLQLLQGFA